MPARLRQVPVSLAVLLALAAVVAVAWSIALPPLQGPDETGHVAYVQRIAEQGSIPFKPRRGGGTRDVRVGTSTELRTAAVASGLDELRANPAARAPSKGDERIWAARSAGFGDAQRSDGGFNVTFRNPPLYYLYATPAYLVAEHASLFARIQWMRWANVPLLLALVAITWALAGELLGTALAPRTLAAGLVALQPGVCNLAGVVSPDLLLVVLYGAGTLLAVRVARHGVTWPRALGLAALVAAAGLTQGRGLPLAVPAALALIGAWAKTSRRSPRAVAAALGVLAAGALAGFLLVLYAPTQGNARPSFGALFDYVWQFWLPRLPGMSQTIGPHDYGAGQAFVARLWGGFAQLEVELPGWEVTVLTIASVALLVAIAAALWRRRALRADPWTAATVAGAAIALVAFLHVTAYRSMLKIPGDPIITGRYLLPVVPLLAVGVAYAVTSLPRRFAASAGGAVIGAAVVLQLSGLALVVERFHA